VSCVVARAQAAQFDAPDGGHATIQVPVTFVNDNGVGCPTGKSKPQPKPEPPKAELKPEAKPAAAPPAPIAGGPLGAVGHAPRPCGAAADLPFDERRTLWNERLARAHSAAAALVVYRAAMADCEAQGWRERYALLIAMVGALNEVSSRVELWRLLLSSPAAADVVYRSIVARVQTADDLRQFHEALGIKTLDADLLSKLLKSGKSAQERLQLLRNTALKWPDDLELGLSVLDAYEDAGDDAGARALARRIRRRPDATAHVRTSIGELLLRLSQREQGAPAERDANEARRCFGELVEFAPEDPVARRRLGDLLRAHGWYEEAFRQYETLAQLTPDDQSVPLLLAAAAFGMGRVEEAVRWAEKAAETGSPDDSSPLSASARATASAFLAWARLAATAANKKDELERLRGRARRLAQASASGGGVRLIATWAHPELRPALWTTALGAPMPATDNFPMFGVAECVLPESPAPSIELRLEPEDAARAARLGVKAVVTAIVGEGTPSEHIARLEVGFGGGAGPPQERVRVVFDGGALRTEAP
ncbi:MAG TPA: tetratricopeptide repeat protein, partial [Polyangiaceae bacterium]|nr:tetratricopeptide repeat protein [Polyangiaceae bacterium]